MSVTVKNVEDTSAFTPREVRFALDEHEMAKPGKKFKQFYYQYYKA